VITVERRSLHLRIFTLGDYSSIISIPVKPAAFHELLESVRDAGAYRKGVARTEQISSKRHAASRAKLKRG
jgi:hypothetical protein